MRKVGGRRLWIGNAGDLADVAGLMAEEIAAVVELSDSEPFANLPRDLIRCRFPLSDGGDNPPWLLRFAAESIAALLHAGVPTLVCCSAGLSRSLALAAAAVALAEDRPLREALRSLAEAGPADLSPGLWSQLQDSLGED